MKAIGKLVAVAALCACGFGGYVFYQQNMAPHPAIVACEDVVKGVLVSPSSYVLEKALMVVNNDRSSYPSVMLSFNSQNKMGANLRSTAICEYYFEEGDIESITDKTMNERRINAYYLDKSPFESFNLVSVQIDGEKVDKLAAMLGNVTFKVGNGKKSSYSRKGPGKIISVTSSMDVTYEPETLIYSPKEFIRYR